MAEYKQEFVERKPSKLDRFVQDWVLNPGVWLAGLGTVLYFSGRRDGFEHGYRTGLEEGADIVVVNVDPSGRRR